MQIMLQIQSVRKKKENRLFRLLWIFFINNSGLAVGLFAFNTIRSKIEEREQQKLEARFDYEEKFSAEEKLIRSFEKGEISADTYVLQLAYSLYDVEKLDPLYKSDNDVDFPPDVVNAVLEHEDELSDETLEYIASKF